ncbi:hypothetical protein ACFY2H_42250 [Streptomyces griseofuscus]|uniref:hypothetical protein n=1 Tax=Streptomyces griseofuscus TaxID=146922 RepID=UPI0036BE2702
MHLLQEVHAQLTAGAPPTAPFLDAAGMAALTTAKTPISLPPQATSRPRPRRRPTASQRPAPAGTS